MGKALNTPLRRHRATLRSPKGGVMTQTWIAILAGFPKCQGQVSKIERGHLPADPDEQKAWARAYRLSLRRLRMLVSAAQSWELPLWHYAVPEQHADVEDIDRMLQRMTAELVRRKA